MRMDGRPVCYVIGAGDFHGPLPDVRPSDFVIAADGGYTHWHAQGGRIDLLVGDFDSLPSMPEDVETMALPVEKDDTDMLAALRVGLARGYRLFHLYGGTGGRLDHTLANIQCLAYLTTQGARGFLHSQDDILTAFADGAIAFPAGSEGILSVFSLTDQSTGVYETGLKYALDNATIANTFPVGVSNEFTGSPCRVSVRKGTLLALYPRDVHEVLP